MIMTLTDTQKYLFQTKETQFIDNLCDNASSKNEAEFLFRMLEEFQVRINHETAQGRIDWQPGTLHWIVSHIIEPAFVLRDFLHYIGGVYPIYLRDAIGGSIKQHARRMAYHDIGKLHPRYNLLLDGKSDYSLIRKIKEHPNVGYWMLNKSNDDNRRIALLHHERKDGSGYPFGLKAEQVTADFQAISLVDYMHSRMTERGYDKKNGNHIFTQEEAKDYANLSGFYRMIDTILYEMFHKFDFSMINLNSSDSHQARGDKYG